ncbi:MAG: helix-turn-helix transcriptional regulator [candidate division WOR-3 bacterium]
MSRGDLEDIAKRTGTSLGYLLQIKYGNRRPSPELARAIEEAARDCGFPISRLDLLYPKEFRERKKTQATEEGQTSSVMSEKA